MTVRGEHFTAQVDYNEFSEIARRAEHDALLSLWRRL